MSSVSPSTAEVVTGLRVVGRDGLTGEVEQTPGDRAILRLANGRRVLVYATQIHLDDGIGRLDLGPEDVDASARRAGHPDTGGGGGDGESHVIPILEERLHVGKERVETGRVHISKRVIEHTETLAPELAREDVDVERVAVGRVVEDPTDPPQPRHEGETLVVPLLEERVVVQKQLVVREELRITRRTSNASQPQEVVLRHEEAHVERRPPSGESA